MYSEERMFRTEAVVLRAFFLALLLNLPQAEAIEVDHVSSFIVFVQTHSLSWEVMSEFDEDEVMYVDQDKKETIWYLPSFHRSISFDAQSGLENIAVTKSNLDTLVQLSNHTQAPNEPPEVSVFPKNPVELGQPNTLICHIDKFFPPVLNVTWLRNGQPVTEGVFQTVFLPRTDYRFQKFHYLTFIPTAEDFFGCQVEHWGLDEPSVHHWEAPEPVQVTEMTETVICALGLMVGLVGIIVGTVLTRRALYSSHDPQAQGPLRIEHLNQGRTAGKY